MMPKVKKIIKLLTLTCIETWQDWVHLHYHSWSDSTRFVRGRKYHTAHKNSQYWDSRLHIDFVPKLIHMQLVPRKEKTQKTMRKMFENQLQGQYALHSLEY